MICPIRPVVIAFDLIVIAKVVSFSKFYAKSSCPIWF